MQLNDIIQSALNYARGNIVASVSAAVLLLFLLFKKPRMFFVLALVLIIAIGIMELFSSLEALGLGNLK